MEMLVEMDLIQFSHVGVVSKLFVIFDVSA